MFLNFHFKVAFVTNDMIIELKIIKPWQWQ